MEPWQIKAARRARDHAVALAIDRASEILGLNPAEMARNLDREMAKRSEGVKVPPADRRE